MSLDRVSGAYAKRAAEYIDALGFIEATAEEDRALIGAWAGDVPGSILDVGCGPGHWTAWLHKRGHDIEGVDPVPVFIDHATATYPGVPFRVGRAENLHVEDSSLGGILAWYSLIHTDPTPRACQPCSVSSPAPSHRAGRSRSGSSTVQRSQRSITQ